MSDVYGGCRCWECEHHCKDGWCRHWEAYTDDEGYCHKGDYAADEDDDGAAAREYQREMERLTNDWTE